MTKFVRDGEYFIAMSQEHGISGRGKSWVEAARNLIKFLDEMKEDQNDAREGGWKKAVKP